MTSSAPEFELTSRLRFRFDRSVERFGDVLLGGSPLRVLRFNGAAQRLLDTVWPAALTEAPFDMSGDSARRVEQLLSQLVQAGMLHPDPHPRPIHANVTIVTPALQKAGQIAGQIFAPGATEGESRIRRVLVDDGSHPPIENATIRLDRNQGPAAARNAGLAIVTTPFVAFVDTDVTVGGRDDSHPDGDEWLTQLMGHFDDPLVALVAPRVRSVGVEAAQDDGSWLASYETDHSPLDLGPDPALVSPGSRVAYVPSTAILCRTDALRQVGGFDESLRFGEDVDLVWRLTEAGFRCRYDPSVVVTHPPRSTWRGWWQQRVGYGTSAAPLAARHGDAVAPARLNRWSLLVWLVALGGPVSWLTGLLIALVAAAQLPRRIPALPPERARRLAVVGTWRAGGQLATAVRRGWWPLLVVAALGSRRARRALVLSVVLARHPFRLADDTAYSVGVWKGCLAGRSLRALAPKIT